MSEEEKKAIEWLKEFNEKETEPKTILNLFEKQQEQLQEKDKVIYEMAIYIAGLDIDEDICKKTGKSDCDEMALGECEECVIEYFTKKAREV